MTTINFRTFLLFLKDTPLQPATPVSFWFPVSPGKQSSCSDIWQLQTQEHSHHFDAMISIPLDVSPEMDWLDLMVTYRHWAFFIYLLPIYLYIFFRKFRSFDHHLDCVTHFLMIEHFAFLVYFGHHSFPHQITDVQIFLLTWWLYFFTVTNCLGCAEIFRLMRLLTIWGPIACEMQDFKCYFLNRLKLDTNCFLEIRQVGGRRKIRRHSECVEEIHLS